MRIPLAQGRLPGSGDGPDAPRVAAASASLARRLWPAEPAIGKRIRLESPEGPWITVVGVVGDVESSALFRTPQPTLYVPFAQSPEGEMDIAVRAAGDPMRLAPDVRAAVRSLDPGQPLLNLNTLETLIRQESFGFAYIGALMGIFGLLALVLSAIGLYGLMAYQVSERTHEFGVRMALGANRGSVLALVFRNGMLPVGIGFAVGLAPAYGLAVLMRSMFLGISLADLVSYWQIPLALVAAEALAMYIPARRATRIDPMAALRDE
jgi:putative ABC transport system permease protein